MYHQPTALPGLGGAYLYQWNDDRCNMKHNFICRYNPGSDQVQTRSRPASLWLLHTFSLHLLSVSQSLSEKRGTLEVGGAQVRTKQLPGSESTLPEG